MNMQRVKNVVILMLAALNLVLGGLIIDRSNRYTLSEKQRTAIHSILSQNYIGLYTTLPTDFAPRKMLSIRPYVFDEAEMQAYFFPQEGDVPRREEDPNGRLVGLIGETAELYLEMGRLTYLDAEGFLPRGYTDMPQTSGDVQKMVDALVEEFATAQMKFTLDNQAAYAADGYVVYEYRGTYRGQILYSSFIKCKVTEAGITELRCSFGIPEGYTGEARDIYSCDEALLSLLGELKSIYGSMESEVIRISRIDMVYYLEESPQNNLSTLRAVPYYRIYIRTAPESPFLINAYNNNVLR